MADIFISYERSDHAHAEEIAAVLEHNGWSVWWDRKLYAGETFDRTIQQALNDARCVIVLWSKTSVGSAWVKDEASDGARRDILVPVLIDDVDIPLGFRQIHTVRADDIQTAAGSSEFDDIVKSVRHLLRGTEPTKHPMLASDLRPIGRSDSKARTWSMVAAVVAIVVLGAGVALRQFVLVGGTGTPAATGDDATAAGSSQASPTAPPAAAPTGPADPGGTTPPTLVAASNIVVSGTGKGLYYVYDSAGAKQLGYAFTNREIELFPGTYQVALNDVRQTATVRAKRQTVVEAGTILVPGPGKDLYYVYESTGAKQLAYAFTNREIEMFPGTYQVALNNVRQTTTVQAKRQTVVGAGRILVPGTGKDLYYVYDSTGAKQLAYAFTNREIELFPGAYVVALNQIKRPVQVSAQQTTTIDR